MYAILPGPEQQSNQLLRRTGKLFKCPSQNSTIHQAFQIMFSISTIERETGLSKDILRKWETRFGFPMPTRKARGERFYTADDLHRLMAIKRLLDSGLRPSAVVPLSLGELRMLALERAGSSVESGYEDILEEVRQALRSTERDLLANCLGRALLVNGMGTFVLAIMPALNRMVGEGWANGSLSIYQEHLYSETVRNLLLGALGRLEPLPGAVRVLLSTAPEERHDLGMVMAQSAFAMAGACCISLGTETPASELVSAAVNQRVQVVALSFSVAFSARRILPFLQQVRSGLPNHIEVWAGGAGMQRTSRALPGVHTFSGLEAATQALHRLERHSGAGAAKGS